MYKKINLFPQMTERTDCVERILDGACIPFAPDNTDYQAYLKWLAEGNTPLPAENA